VSGRPARETAASWVPAVLMAPPKNAAPAPSAAPVEAHPPLRRRLAWWLIVGVAGLVLLAGSAALAFWSLNRSPSPDIGIVLSATTVRAGDTIVVVASGLPPNQGGTVQLHSVPEQIASFEADRTGNLHADVVIPSIAMPGEHA